MLRDASWSPAAKPTPRLDRRHEQVDELRHLAVDLVDPQTSATLHPHEREVPTHQRQHAAGDEQPDVEPVREHEQDEQYRADERGARIRAPTKEATDV